MSAFMSTSMSTVEAVSDPAIFNQINHLPKGVMILDADRIAARAAWDLAFAQNPDATLFAAHLDLGPVFAAAFKYRSITADPVRAFHLALCAVWPLAVLTPKGNGGITIQNKAGYRRRLVTKA